MDLFEKHQFKDIRSKDRDIVQTVGKTPQYIVPINDTDINETYITGYALCFEESQNKLLLIYRNQQQSVSNEKVLYFKSPREAQTFISETENSILQLNILESIFLTWDDFTIQLSDFEIQHSTLCFMLYIGIISMRFFKEIIKTDPIVFSNDNLDKTINISNLDKKCIHIGKSNSKLAEYLSFKIYSQDPQPWIIFTPKESKFALNNITNVKDVVLLSEVEDLEKYREVEFPNIPIYKFSIFDLQSKIKDILKYVGESEQDTLVTVIARDSDVTDVNIGDNITFIQKGGATNNDYYIENEDICVNKEVNRVNLFDTFESKQNINCEVNRDKWNLHYSSELLSILDVSEPHLHINNFYSFTETLFD